MITFDTPTRTRGQATITCDLCPATTTVKTGFGLPRSWDVMDGKHYCSACNKARLDRYRRPKDGTI